MDNLKQIFNELMHMHSNWHNEMKMVMLMNVVFFFASIYNLIIVTIIKEINECKHEIFM